MLALIVRPQAQLREPLTGFNMTAAHFELRGLVEPPNFLAVFEIDCIMLAICSLSFPRRHCVVCLLSAFRLRFALARNTPSPLDQTPRVRSKLIGPFNDVLVSAWQYRDLYRFALLLCGSCVAHNPTLTQPAAPVNTKPHAPQTNRYIALVNAKKPPHLVWWSGFPGRRAGG